MFPSRDSSISLPSLIGLRVNLPGIFLRFRADGAKGQKPNPACCYGALGNPFESFLLKGLGIPLWRFRSSEEGVKAVWVTLKFSVSKVPPFGGLDPFGAQY